MNRLFARRVGITLAVLLVVCGSMLILRAVDLQPVGTWAPVASGADSRTEAASVALADGRTLIAGGVLVAAGTVTDSVVIYDPATNAFESAGVLRTPRSGHTATLLADGRVAVIGGVVVVDGVGIVSADIEIFDLATRTSVLAAALGQPRTRHAAARLPSGSVLIVGGADASGAALASAEVYDAPNGASDTIATAYPMSAARAGASATALIDGRVLVAGGNDGSHDLASAEVYEAASQSFQPTGTGLSVARSGHTAILLPHNNSVLVAGGTSIVEGAGAAVAAADLFLPTGDFVPTGAMTAPRSGAIGGPAAAIGYALVAGGGAADADAYRFPTVIPDKWDYQPGDTVHISGAGFTPGEAVEIHMHEDPAPTEHHEEIPPILADDTGTFHQDIYLVQEHDLNVRFYLTATDTAGRMAATTFTDGNLNSLTLSTQHLVRSSSRPAAPLRPNIQSRPALPGMEAAARWI